jgi:hypothetical protein
MDEVQAKAKALGGTYQRRFSDKRVRSITTKYYYAGDVEAWRVAALAAGAPEPAISREHHGVSIRFSATKYVELPDSKILTFL